MDFVAVSVSRQHRFKAVYVAVATAVRTNAAESWSGSLWGAGVHHLEPPGCSSPPFSPWASEAMDWAGIVMERQNCAMKSVLFPTAELHPDQYATAQ